GTEPPGITEWHCDFESDGEDDVWCGLEKIQNGFEIKHGTDAATGTNPATDHTTGTDKGAMLYLSMPSNNNTQRSILRSPEINVPDISVSSCLSVWYTNPSPHAGFIKFKIQNGSAPSDVMGDQILMVDGTFPSLEWQLGIETFLPPASGSFRLQIIGQSPNGKPGSQEESGIALDDVKITDEPCQMPGTCSFQGSTCFWAIGEEENNGQFHWHLHTGSENTTWPKNDHTFQEAAGGYLSAHMKKNYSGPAHTSLESVALYPTPLTGSCFTFWWAKQGGDIATIQVLLKEPSWSSWMVIWSLIGTLTADPSIEGDWHFASVPFNASSVPFKIQIFAIGHKKDAGWIAIDDTDIQEGTCEVIPPSAIVVPVTPSPTTTVNTPTPPLNSWECDFNENVCGLQNVNTSIKWERQNTLNCTDHSEGVWYLSLPKDVDAGSKALAQTRPIQSPENIDARCIVFYYYIYGANTGQISVITKHGDFEPEAIWTQGNPKGASWHKAYIDVTLTTSNFRIQFEGIKGQNKEGEVAIDDIVLKDQQCSSFFPTEKPGVPVACDFEESSLCNYEVEDGKGTFDRVYSNDPNLIFKPPHADHTYNTGYGHYMAAVLTDDRDGKVATLKSPKYDTVQDTSYCIEFWYVHSGTTSRDYLNVYIVNEFDFFPHPDWREESAHVGKWLSANIPVRSNRKSFHMEWEVEQQKRDTVGVITIDDVEVHLKDCKNI
ncbi:unnamed protein product, partial [Meganyctiphanes norvegica]